MIKKFIATTAAAVVLGSGAVAFTGGSADAATYGPPNPIPASQKKPTIKYIKKIANKKGKLTVKQTKKLLAKIDALYDSGLITSVRRAKLRVYVLSR
ncbi:MAG: hypothetical protein QM572_14520 [Nocardioides sp.]|uniref:hypothetical protein n=1 Tax=Nocardioides sp. TaxID=35761 RepID=UPI0039E6C998